MTNASGEWDEDAGYRFNPDKERVPLPGKDEEPEKGGKPVHNDPGDADSMDRSVEEVQMIGQRVSAMKTDRDEDRHERVDISRSTDSSQRGITSDQTRDNPEFRRRRIRNSAVRKVKEHLRERGYSDAFIQENEAMIRQKVLEFLSRS